MTPVALDLCCGLGGWAHGLIAAGWDVVGVDVEPRFAASYPGRFACADMRIYQPTQRWLSQRMQDQKDKLGAKS